MSRLTHGSRIGRMSLTVITWLIGLFFFFPIFWMTLISFRNENEAATFPPTIIAKETLANYKDVFSRGIWSYLLHSGVASIGSTLIVIAIGYPAAYALSIKPIYRSKDVLGFLLSTKFLPPIAALLPLYLILKHLHLMDNLIALMILYVAMNLPLAVWMLRSFLKDIPKE